MTALPAPADPSAAGSAPGARSPRLSHGPGRQHQPVETLEALQSYLAIVNGGDKPTDS